MGIIENWDLSLSVDSGGVAVKGHILHLSHTSTAEEVFASGQHVG